MNGFYTVLKTPDMTSSDVVVKLRGLLRSRTGVRYKVGHLGTLDPGAVGVLPIAVGNATKLFDYMLDKTKVYRAQFVFGTTTDTLDSYGKVVATGPLVCDKAAVMAVAARWVGTYYQLPPAYSAKSVNGVRAYDLARKGIEVDLPTREVTVYSIDLVRQDGNTFTLDIACSGGTYIRALCRDMAATLGTVGYMSSLVRMQSGDFVIEQASTLREIEGDVHRSFVPLEVWAESLPTYYIPAEYASHVANGVVYSVQDMPMPLYRIVVGDTPYGLGCARSGVLKIVCRL